MSKTYSQLQQELDLVLDKLQSESLDIDEAFKLHKQGKALVKQLEDYLEKSEINLKTTKL